MSASAPGAATRTLRVLGLRLELDEPETALRARAVEAAGLAADTLRGFRIARKSLDARRRRGARSLAFVVHVDLVVDAELRSAALERALRSGRVVEAPVRGRIEVPLHASLAGAHVVVVGSGPAGLFAALVLGRSGVRVTLLERGPALRERARALAGFGRTREPDPERNLLFGEGGAGTYSDGKLYTRVEHPLEVPLLEELVACGAPPEIVYDARAHVGTDRLHAILPRLRRRLEACGVEFRFETRVEGLVLRSSSEPARVVAVTTSAGELACDALVLATGHSARDTWQRLAAQGVACEAKPFQLGVRIEHPQALIDAGRHGTGPQARSLGPAYYGLVCKAQPGQPATYSFCMCPGGQIVASVNSPGLLCTNGMSNSRHSSPFANAALVTTLGPRDFGAGAFDGVALQERIERAAFAAGGGDYTAPAQCAQDFLSGRESAELARTSYRFGVRPGRIDALLPPPVRDAVARALVRFERELPGFAGPQAILVGVETRSSGPVRLPRDAETLRARGFANLFPCGEGAGTAGGIMSAAIDGARAAQALAATGVERTGDR